MVNTEKKSLMFLVSNDTIVEVSLLLLGDSKSPEFPLGFL